MVAPTTAALRVSVSRKGALLCVASRTHELSRAYTEFNDDSTQYTTAGPGLHRTAAQVREKGHGRRKRGGRLALFSLMAKRRPLELYG